MAERNKMLMPQSLKQLTICGVLLLYEYKSDRLCRLGAPVKAKGISATVIIIETDKP